MKLAHSGVCAYGVKSEPYRQNSQRDLFEETWNTRFVRHRSGNRTTGRPINPARPLSNRNAHALVVNLCRPLAAHRTSAMNPNPVFAANAVNDLVKIGEDITEQLDVVPAQFSVHPPHSPPICLPTCETITAAPIPPAVIDGGMAAVGLLVWVIISKYLDHLPLYRLEQIAARENLILSRSTLAEWVGRVGVALQPLVDRLTWHLRQGNTLHADETPVAQLDPGKVKPAKPIYGLIAATTSGGPTPRIIVFDYQGT